MSTIYYSHHFSGQELQESYSYDGNKDGRSFMFFGKFLISYFQTCRTYWLLHFRNTTFQTFEPNYIPYTLLPFCYISNIFCLLSYSFTSPLTPINSLAWFVSMVTVVSSLPSVYRYLFSAFASFKIVSVRTNSSLYKLWCFAEDERREIETQNSEGRGVVRAVNAGEAMKIWIVFCLMALQDSAHSKRNLKLHFRSRTPTLLLRKYIWGGGVHCKICSEFYRPQMSVKTRRDSRNVFWK